MSEAVYLVEFGSIPAGIDMLDRMMDRCSALIIYAKPVCIGKFLIVLGGEVDDVREAQAVVLESGEKRVLQQYLLTSAHEEILAYFRRAPGANASTGPVAIGMLETVDAVSGFRSLDAALKGGSVSLEQVWLGHFIGGKFCYILSGQVGDVQAALAAAEITLEPKRLVDSRVIPSPSEKTLAHLLKTQS